MRCLQYLIHEYDGTMALAFRTVAQHIFITLPIPLCGGDQFAFSNIYILDLHFTPTTIIAAKICVDPILKIAIVYNFITAI